MDKFFCILLRQDVPDFSNVMEVKGGRPWNLFNICVKREVLVKDNAQVSDSGAEVQGNAIQINNDAG